jgi:hypothetical protein
MPLTIKQAEIKIVLPILANLPIGIFLSSPDSPS